ncbi:hypothetical protein [Lysinibacillus piscis]|uniref:HNH endonuclease n=1 Tax=Lysinibacillus piscis TaxID=2518931 RepID=A0ABQ5NK48_9BACI|nr:hypothetical protein [Lysinibacillus sp. KH24]GLC88673.1 hypothetical protein LYSBPC_18000 [Lysinibacillus sp. KH24]
MRLEYWHAEQNGLVRCPVTGCHHIGTVITKTHLRLEHGLTRDEVQNQFGFPKKVHKLNRAEIEKMIEQKNSGVKA